MRESRPVDHGGVEKIASGFIYMDFIRGEPRAYAVDTVQKDKSNVHVRKEVRECVSRLCTTYRVIEDMIAEIVDGIQRVLSSLQVKEQDVARRLRRQRVFPRRARVQILSVECRFIELAMHVIGSPKPKQSCGIDYS